MGTRVLLSSFIVFWAGWFFLLNKKEWDLQSRTRRCKAKVKTLALSSFVFDKWKNLSLVRKREILHRELADCLAYIKNIVLLGRGENMSTELLLEELADMTDALASTFIDMAHCLHISEKQRAQEVFYEAFETDYSKDIAQFLLSWESIPTKELLGTVTAYRNSLLQERLTKQKRRDELVSDLIYFPVVLNSMAVLLNFIYVAYFIEQREALMGIF